MQPGGRRNISQNRKRKHRMDKFFLAFYIRFCYTEFVTAARGWEYARFREYRFPAFCAVGK